MRAYKLQGPFRPSFLAASPMDQPPGIRHSYVMSQHKCRRCRGTLIHRIVEHPYWNGSTLVAVVHDVPALVCQLCGYHHFEPAVESSLHSLVKDYIKMGTIFPIPSTPYRETQNA